MTLNEGELHAGQEGAFRLVNGETNADVAYGVPQIFHAGAWGTLCDGDIFRYDYVEGSQYAGLSTFGDVRFWPYLMYTIKIQFASL